MPPSTVYQGYSTASMSTVPPGAAGAAELADGEGPLGVAQSRSRAVSLVEGAQDIQIPGITPGTTSSLLCPFLKQQDGMWTVRSVSGVLDCTCNLARAVRSYHQLAQRGSVIWPSVGEAAGKSYCHTSTQVYSATIKPQRKRDRCLE